MRTSIIAVAALCFFALVPAVFAGGVTSSWDNAPLANGAACTAPSQCIGGACVGRDSEGIGVCATANPSGGGNINPSAGGNPATNVSGQNTTLINPLGAGTNLSKLVTDILQFVIRIGSIFIILMLVYVGFLFVNARGNATEISSARRALLWTIVGALILLGAQAIAIGIQATVQALSSGS